MSFHKITEPMWLDRNHVFAAGITELCAPIHISKNDIVVRGEAGAWLVRGRMPTGDLYAGPMLVAQGRRGVTVENLNFDGGRFAAGVPSPTDFRHPLTNDRSDPKYPCAICAPEPGCYEPRNFHMAMEACVLWVDSEAMCLRDCQILSAPTIGVAIGRGCQDVQLLNLGIHRSGQFGLWIGAALSDRPPLELDHSTRAWLPRHVRVHGLNISASGAAGAHVEGTEVELKRCHFVGNHCDFPFNESGGQVVVDYKSSSVRVEACTIAHGPRLVRRQVHGPALELAAVGVEANGRELHFVDNLIFGNAREAIHLNGASDVHIGGARTRLHDNHCGASQKLARPDISITTSLEFAQLGAVARDLGIGPGVVAEGGVLTWSHGSNKSWRMAGLDLQSPIQLTEQT